MKALSIAISLSVGAVAQESDSGKVVKSIRAARMGTKAKGDLAASASPPAAKERKTGRSRSRQHPKEREKMAQRIKLADDIHRRMFNKDGTLKEKVEQPLKSRDADRKLKMGQRKGSNAQDKASSHETSKNNEGPETMENAQSKEDRELTFKAKSDKGDWGGGDWGASKPSGWGGGGWGGGFIDDFDDDDDYDDDDDKWGATSGDLGGIGDRFKVGDGWGGGGWGGKSDKGGWDGGGWGGKSGKGDWGGGGSGGGDWGGKSDKGDWGGGDWGGKSGKGDWGGGGWGGKSDKGWGGGGGGSGKSGKGWGGGGWDDDGWGGCHGGYAFVTVTNLSFRQSFSEIFVMTATRDVTRRRPLFIFGNRTNEALAELATEADATGMLNRYDNRFGVEQTKIFDDFVFDDNNFLNGGSRARFKIRTSGFGHRLSIAAGLPFTNDGAVVLEGARIYDGAEYWVPAIDVGAEGNIQTCWSVAAMMDDFPPLSECSRDDLSDDNINDVGGENFVSMHRGIWDADGKDELELVLLFPECKDLDLDDCDNEECFANYFNDLGFEDDDLLCRGGPQGPFFCDFWDDQEFLDNLDSRNDDVRILDFARQSQDFQDFCDLIVDRNKDIEDSFVILEQAIFDWRNEMMHVEIDCGWDGDFHRGEYDYKR